MKNIYSASCTVLTCSALVLSSASADYVTSPPPPNANRIGPGIFLIKSSEMTSAREQDVHAASAFAGATGPVLLITGISYSAPAWSGRFPIDVTLPSIEIRMSTTAKDPDALSTLFADNVGSDESMVYSGPLRFYETETERYDIHIPITPFLYDPAAGNLLIDVFNYAPIFSRPDPDWVVDFAEWNDSVSSVSGRGADSSGTLSTYGLMTRFSYTPVPEPSTWAILAIGVAIFGIGALNRLPSRWPEGQRNFE